MRASAGDFTHAEIAAYYSTRAPALKQAMGQEWWRGPCPIHFGTRDSFSVNSKSGVWHCFSQCGRGGSIFDLEQMLTDVSRSAAVLSVMRIVGRRA